MESIGYDRRQAKMAEMFNAKREGLRACYREKCAQIGVDVDDALAKSFEFTVKGLLAKSEDFVSADFEKIMRWKMSKLIKDAIAATKRTHGRRSVRAIPILDEEPSDGDVCRVSLIDKASRAWHAECAYREGEENRFLLQVKAVEMTMKKDGVSDRDYEIFDASFFRKEDRKALAVRFNTTVSNVGRIKCECSQRLPKLIPQIRNCYFILLKEYGILAA